MTFKTIFPILLATACACAAHAQEEKEFDAEKTKALFAGTEWNTHFSGWHSEATFTAEGMLYVKADGYGDKNRTDKWTPSGPRSVKGDKAEWVLAPDGKELYMTDDGENRHKFLVFHRGQKYPPEYPFLRSVLANPGTVWVRQGGDTREVLAFNTEIDAILSVDGVEEIVENGLYIFGAGQFGFAGIKYLVQDEKGERYLRD